MNSLPPISSSLPPPASAAAVASIHMPTGVGFHRLAPDEVLSDVKYSTARELPTLMATQRLFHNAVGTIKMPSET
jgi:hypothetical protein